MIRSLAAVLGLCLAVPFSNLRVQPEEENLPSGRLAGTWVPDAQLCERLGSKTPREELRFREDASVLEAVPAELAEALGEFRIYEAGIVEVRPAVPGGKGSVFTGPYLLTAKAGVPMLLILRARSGEALDDEEAVHVFVVPAREREDEILLMGGDSDNQPFDAWRRKEE